MHYLFKNHGDLNASRLVFKVDMPEKMEVGQVQSNFEKDFLKDLKVPTKPSEIDTYLNGTFNEKYGPEAYETAFQKVAQRYIKNADARGALIKEARLRYETKYKKLRQSLANLILNKQESRNSAIDGIHQATKADLKPLMEAVQKGNQVDRLKSEIENGNAVQKGQMMNLIHALNTQHFNIQLLQRYRLTDRQKDQYRELADGFKSGMRNYMNRHVDQIIETEKDPRKRLLALRQLAKTVEEKYNSISQSDGLIDFQELKRLSQEAQKRVDLMQLVNNSNNDEALIKQLEATQWLKPEDWVSGAMTLVNQLIKDAHINGSESQLIAYAKEKTGTKGDMSLGTAISYIRNATEAGARLGIEEGLKVMREINEGVNKKRADILAMNDINPKSIHVLVYREREHLLTGRLEPKDPNAIHVVQFMRANRAQREILLTQEMERIRTAQRMNQTVKGGLFQSIKNILKHYPKTYNKEFKRGLPKKAGELRYGEPGRPTAHDKAARLLALLTLAKEAEWTVNNFSNSDRFKDFKLANHLDSTIAEKNSPQIDLRFHDPQKKYRVGYISRASRDGFNGRDIALGLVKLWAGATVLMNVMNSRKDLSKIATNPYILAAAGTIYGIKKYQNNPEAKNYFLETAGGQERIKTHISLNTLSKKIEGGKSALQAYVHNSTEFRAMHALMKNTKIGKPNQKIIKVLKKAQLRSKKEGVRPTLTKDDLKQALNNATGTDDLYYQLPKKGNDRMRYLFYSKFLTSGRSTRALQKHCAQWPKKVIS